MSFAEELYGGLDLRSAPTSTAVIREIDQHFALLDFKKVGIVVH